MFGNTAFAPATVLTSQRPPDHARNTKVGIIELPQADQLIDDGLLLSDAVHFWHKARVINHASDVEPACQGSKEGEGKVPKPGRICLKSVLQLSRLYPWLHTFSKGCVREDGEQPVYATPKQGCRKYSRHPRL